MLSNDLLPYREMVQVIREILGEPENARVLKQRGNNDRIHNFELRSMLGFVFTNHCQISMKEIDR